MSKLDCPFQDRIPDRHLSAHIDSGSARIKLIKESSPCLLPSKATLPNKIGDLAVSGAPEEVLLLSQFKEPKVISRAQFLEQEGHQDPHRFFGYNSAGSHEIIINPRSSALGVSEEPASRGLAIPWIVKSGQMGKYIVKSNPMWFIILMILNIIKGEANGGEPHFETKLEQKSYLFDSFGQHDEIKGVYVLYKPTYERLKSLKSIHIDSLFYASTDGGRSVSLKNLVLEDKPFIVNRVQAVKDHWFCVSISNRSFIYLDKNLQAVHSRHLDEDPFYNPHPLFPEYLIHFVSHYKPDFVSIFHIFQ
ncbi:hypothetical protein RF11_01153 [Thelohanellus kitauei]|uniref:Uncharacterized protein n=1 Tax=Thelohanellus kitauei TaxID=669202 RepID=A0A0C2MRH1_THEKT|nr:hypothetical protein RF11_01153 [Thelohanellus kitauei]